MFRKKAPVAQPLVESVDQIVFKQLTDDNHKLINDLADQMIKPLPVVISFEKLDIDDANKLLAFFSGVIYTIKGQVLKVNEHAFLFAQEALFTDGSLDKFIAEYQNN